MSQSGHCEQCQALLLPDAPEGLCSACLLKFALQGDFAEPAPTATAASGGQRANAGFVFGDFEVQDEIARGGMGVVYRARQISLDRPVALKVILVGRWASETQIERFQIEAEAAAKLNHPNIVPVYEIGEVSGQHYLSMPLIEGGNLASRLDEIRSDTSNRRSARFVAKVARAVHYAHERRILHRDLKPTNVLLDSADEPHVTDFGLAKVLESDSDFTRSVAVLGTPSYMAPEQAAGKSKRADVRSDVYSVGAILYELLTGQAPFTAPTPLETLDLVRDREPTSPVSLNPRVHRDLATICLKCLHKEPSRRYASAEALAQDLERWLDGRPILARRPTPVQRIWMWSRRQPAAAVIVVLLLFIAVGLLFVTQHLRQQRDQARQHLWESSLAQAAALRASAEAGRRQQGLEALRKAAAIRPSLEVRNEAIACLALQDLRIRHRWAGFPEKTTAVCADVQQRYYARAAASKITVREIASDREVATLAAPAAVDWLRFSPDAQYLAARVGFSERTCQVHVWDWKSGAQILNLPLPPTLAVPIAFDAKSEWLFVGAQEGRIRRIPLVQGEEAPSLSAGFTPAHILPSPTGHWIAVGFSGTDAELNSTVKVLALDRSDQVVFRYSGNVRSLAWHPNGQVLAVGCNDYRIYEEEVATRKRLKVHERHETPVTDLAYDFDGSLMASASHEGDLVVWDAMEERTIIRTRAGRTQLAFAPASAHLAVGIDPPDLTLWELEGQEVFFQVPKTKTYCSGLDISVDGRWVVMANMFGGLLMADLQERKAARWHDIAGIRSLWFARDGRHIISSGRDGLQKWPVANGRFGEPERLEFPENKPLDGTATADGRKLAVTVNFADLLLGELGSRTNWRSLKARNVHRMRFSPDGNWLAAIQGGKGEIRVWEVPSSATVMRTSSNATAVVFAPHGRWLLGLTGREFRIWEVGSWKLLRVIQAEGVEDVEHPADFSPDTDLLAVVRGFQTVQLLDPNTGEELARLCAPEPSTVQWVQFTPDGHRLVVMTRTRGLRVWNLRLLRKELAAIGLDWRTH